MLEIKVKLIHPEAKIPTRSHETDAAFDLTTVDYVDVTDQDIARIRTGIILELPTGVEAQIWPRSNDMLLDTFIHPGTIDSGYRGEIIVLARMFLGHSRSLIPGSRIGQLKIVALTSCTFALTDQVNETDRGKNGFGSTGQ